MAGEWDESLPIDHLKIGSIPGEFRKITDKVETVLIKEHEDLGDENTGAQHRLGSAVANEGSTTPTKTVDITAGSVALADVARDRGRLWLDDNFDPPVLKRWKGSAWEVVGTIAAGASPNIAKLISTTAEDSDGGRESALAFKGTQTGNEETTLGLIEFSHEGSSDDQKGQWKIKVNDGDDSDAPSKVAIVGKSTGKIDASESLAILDEDDMASDDADVLATQQSIKAYVDAKGVAQIVNTQTGAVDTGTTDMPYDDTIPQITEGDEFMTLAITPTSATNELKIDVVFNFAHDNIAATISAALFQDTTAGALAGASQTIGDDASKGYQIIFTYYMTAGTAVETTFRVRGGGDDGSTTTFNGGAGGRKLGGIMSSSITITEYKV